jgi:hypothetical protein
MFLDQLIAFNHFIDSLHDNSEAYTPSGIHLGDAPKDTCHKDAINQFSIQNLEVAKALEILGEEAWMCHAKEVATATKVEVDATRCLIYWNRYKQPVSIK